VKAQPPEYPKAGKVLWNPRGEGGGGGLLEGSYVVVTEGMDVFKGEYTVLDRTTLLAVGDLRFADVSRFYARDLCLKEHTHCCWLHACANVYILPEVYTAARGSRTNRLLIFLNSLHLDDVTHQSVADVSSILFTLMTSLTNRLLMLYQFSSP
jgi:hypothetical protein